MVSGLQGACRKKQSCVHTAFLLQETVSAALETNKNVFVAFFDVSKAFDTVWTDGLFYKLYKAGIRGKIWRLLYRTYINFLCRVRIKGQFSEWYQMRCGIHQGFFLSLIKYIAFVNSMITEIEESKLCCSVRGIQSTPQGYADDVATACLSKVKLDRVLRIVDNYGKKWRFKFNAKKSAILVYGEDRKLNLLNSKYRSFKLGNDKVPEKQAYDHVGVKACILQDNMRIEDKITKGRRTLNACAGIGIRKNGLTMFTCNIIYWAIIIPMVTFGSEIWCMTDQDHDSLLSFQVYTGKRMQRFPARSPDCSSLFGLGWVRITTFILIKKLLFALSMLRLNDDNVVRMVFLDRLSNYVNLRDRCKTNEYLSPTYDILNAATRFGVFSYICDMATGNSPIMSKRRWSKIIWNNAWRLEDAYWNSTKILHKDNDLLQMALTCSRYLCWWELADKRPHLIRMCENMAKLVSHSSRLRGDDLRLKGLTHQVIGIVFYVIRM